MTDGITEARALACSRHVIHVHVDLRGLLSSRRKIVGLVDTATGRDLDDAAARRRLIELVADGVHCLPIGEPCPGFSFKTGCPGHEEP